MSRPAKRHRPEVRSVRDGTERRRGRVTVQHPQIRVAQVGLALSVVAAMTGGVVEGVAQASTTSGSTTSGTEQIEVTVPPPTTTTTLPLRCRPRQGFWLSAASGAVVSEGGATNYGSSLGRQVGGRNVGLVATRDRKGYWEVAANGVVSPFGDARAFGQPRAVGTSIVDLAATGDDDGYWLIAADGAVYAYGDAKSFGQLEGRLSAPIVALVPTGDDDGYWLIGADGTVYPFGNAPHEGSIDIRPGHPVVAATSDDAEGFWLETATGTVYPFGDAVSYGPLAGQHPDHAAVAMAADAIRFPLSQCGAHAGPLRSPGRSFLGGGEADSVVKKEVGWHLRRTARRASARTGVD